MWIVLSLASAFFAGVTSILAKIGIKDTDSNLATALRTVVVAIFAWLMVFVVGSQSTLASIDNRSLIFLALSGLATGASWLCYFRALQIGDVSKVVPVDKSSTVLTMLMSFFLLGEGLTLLKGAAMALIGAGTYLMTKTGGDKTGGRFTCPHASPQSSPQATKQENRPNAYQWLLFAVLSAVFASLTAILGKVGIVGVEANLGTAIRTVVVLIMAWIIVLTQGKHREVKKINGRSWLFLGLSGVATGLSWLCFYRALQEGPVSVIVPIDKLSILITIAFGCFVLRERLHKKPAIGLMMIVIGTLGLLFV